MRFRYGWIQIRQARGLPNGCGTTGIRTWDTRIFNPLLYQLSYSTEQERANIVLLALPRNVQSGILRFSCALIFGSPGIEGLQGLGVD